MALVVTSSSYLLLNLAFAVVAAFEQMPLETSMLALEPLS
jgi:hypothetical protein